MTKAALIKAREDLLKVWDKDRDQVIDFVSEHEATIRDLLDKAIGGEDGK